MQIYLIQHGTPVDKALDINQPLSSEGIAQIKAIAKFFASQNIVFDQVLTSPKMRSTQTAELLCDSYTSTEHMQPTAKPENLIPEINIADGSLLLSGHLPFLNDFASHLLSPKETINLGIKMGGVCRIDIEDPSNSNGTLVYLIPPEFLIK